MRHPAAMLLLLVPSGLVCAQQSPEYQACSDQAKTQTATNACASDEAARADAQLNVVYRALLQKTSDGTAATKIRAAERAWVTYRDAYIDAMYPADDKQAEYGSVYPMEIAVLRAQLTRVQIAALHDLSQEIDKAPQALPEGFASAVRSVKSKVRIPILLPSALPEPFNKAKRSVVQSVSEDSYAISLYYELGIGDAGFAADFSGAASQRDSGQEFGNAAEVKLARGLHGTFTPIRCGGSCAPANLWWELGGVVYQIQLKLPYSLNEEERQKKAIIEVANSAILAGPR